jgi:hypothetical protein
LILKTKVDTNIDGLSVVWLQNHWDDFSNLTSKLVATVSFGFALKPMALGFSVCAIKLTATV